MSEHRIKPKRTTTSGIDGVPTTSNLEAGEIAINLADKKLFVRDTSNNILELTTRTINSLDDATISSPTTGEVLTYNAGLVGWENTAATSAEWVTTEHVVTSAGQQAFSAAYTVGSLDVFLNGIRLDTSDYTAYSGILIILDTGAAIGDTVYISSYTLTSGALPSQSGNSGKYLTTDGTTATWATVAADTNNYVDSLAFSTSTGVLTVGRSGALGDLTVDLDGKYLPLTGGTMTGATNFIDSAVLSFGYSGDLQIYHDGTHSYINDTGTGDLIIVASNNHHLKFANGHTAIHTVENAEVNLRYANVNKLATTSTGINVTGNITASTITSTGNTNIGGELNLTATGNNYVDFVDTLRVRAQGSSPAYEASITAFKDGAVDLAHNGVKRLATTSTGIDVTGNINVNSVAELGVYSTTTGGILKINGTTANKQSVLKTTNGNLHIDSADGNSLYLNYYTGSTNNVVFGDGNGGQSGVVVSSGGGISAKSLTVTGNITATGTITAYYSDERLKTNLGNISSPLDKVLKLNGFNYIENKLANSFGYDSTSIQVGVSAQDVQKVLPAAVSIAPFDRGEKGLSKSGEDYLTVDYAKMVPLLIEAIKELKEEVDSLKGARDEQ
jgi:hypothetical protein